MLQYKTHSKDKSSYANWYKNKYVKAKILGKDNCFLFK